MKVRDLRKVIEDRDGGAPLPVEVQELLAAMAPLDDMSIDDFSKLIASAAAKRKKPAASKAKAALNEEVVLKYLDELSNTKSDNAAFETVVKRASKDKGLKAGEAQEIANRFTGQVIKFKSKTEALKAVLARQIADKRAQERASQVSELF